MDVGARKHTRDVQFGVRKETFDKEDLSIYLFKNYCQRNKSPFPLNLREGAEILGWGAAVRQ